MEEPTPPAVSVIMPVYNRAAVVRRAIDSVLGQDFTDFELIVVDDGSSDGSADIVAASDDPRLRLIRLPANGGGNAARNRGIRAARAPLVAFLDSDDYYLPHKLGFAVDFFRNRPDVDVLLDSFVKSYEAGRKRPDVELRNPVLGSNEKILEALYLRLLWKATPGITVRRDAAVRAGLFDEGLRRRQDFDFIVRLAKVARIATTDQLLWVKVNSSDAISAGLDSFAASTIGFTRRHPEYLDNPAYRVGLAQDLARHFGRLASRWKFGAAWRDAKPLAREYGLARFLRLVGEGSGRMKMLRDRRRNAGRAHPS